MAMRRSGKSEDDRQELTVHTIMKFLKDRDFPPAKAGKLSLGLGLKTGKLGQFKRENPDLEDLLMAVISHWLHSDSAKSWDKLADALRFCDCNIIADEIQGRRPPTKRRTAVEQFPFIDVKELQDNETLRIRLELDSEKIGQEFASLVVLTSASLEKQHYSVQKLIILIKNLPNKNESNNCLIQSLKKVQNILDAIEEMSNYWSFFNYELLEAVIRSSNDPELITKLDKYVERFTHYCKRRLCEVPVDALTAKEVHTKNVVTIKLGKLFNVQLEDVKKTIVKIDSILGTSLHLVGVEPGCVELTFICMHKLDAIFPLSYEQRKKISHTKTLKIYSDTEVYYERGHWSSYWNTERVGHSFLSPVEKSKRERRREGDIYGNRRGTMTQSTTIVGVGAAAGGAGVGGGMAAGGLLGSVVPVAGTAIGAAIGAGAGIISGYLYGNYLNAGEEKRDNKRAKREANTARDKDEREAKIAREKEESDTKRREKEAQWHRETCRETFKQICIILALVTVLVAVIIKILHQCEIIGHQRRSGTGTEL